MSRPLQSYEPEITVGAAGREWRLRRAADFDSLWEDMVADGRADADEHIPYWTELWPSSLVLCSWLAQNQGRIAGRRCLDLGCGIGLTALAGSSLGARVLGIDYEMEALVHAADNARINGVPSPAWAAMDWRRPCVARGVFDCIWGGDIMYERRFVEPVLAVCEHALAAGGCVWVAEPGREVYDAFLKALPERGWTGRRVLQESVDAMYAQACKVTVTIWELRRLQDQAAR